MENDRYAFWPLPERPPLHWPDSARVAVWVIPNIEHFRLDSRFAPDTIVPDTSNYAQRDYGNRAGIWRLAEVLDKHGVRATVALNSDVCRFEPQVIKAGVERGWEWMGHGITNSQRLSGLDPEAERSLIQEVVDTIAESTGSRPRGWLSPGLTETLNTPDLLAESGISYVADWVADEQPFPMRVKDGRLISVPYGMPVNDLPLFLRAGWTAEQFYQMICDQFDVLYEDGQRSGRVMAIALHPFLSGHPMRAKWLDKALGYIAGHDHVWLTTGGEIANWYYREYYDEAVRLAPFPRERA